MVGSYQPPLSEKRADRIGPFIRLNNDVLFLSDLGRIVFVHAVAPYFPVANPPPRLSPLVFFRVMKRRPKEAVC